MAFGSCFTCFRYSVFILNFLLWVLGCALLAVGGWLLTEEDAGRYVEKATSTSDQHSFLVISYSQVTDTDVATPLAYLFLVFGAILVLVAFIGCCGAVRDNTCLLITFGVLLLVIFLVLAGVGVVSFMYSKNVDVRTPRLQRVTNETVRSAVRRYYTDVEARHFMLAIQSKLECCGADKANDDYTKRGPVGDSPCEVAYQRKSCLPVYFDYVANHFEAFVRDRLFIVASLSTAFALTLVVHMLCVLLLCCAVRERSRNVGV